MVIIIKYISCLTYSNHIITVHYKPHVVQYLAQYLIIWLLTNTNTHSSVTQ